MSRILNEVWSGGYDLKVWEGYRQLSVIHALMVVCCFANLWNCIAVNLYWCNWHPGYVQFQFPLHSCSFVVLLK